MQFIGNKHDQIFNKYKLYQKTPLTSRSRESSVGISTRNELEGPGIESRWWRDFPHLSTPILGFT
jgi:hypothetical protein